MRNKILSRLAIVALLSLTALTGCATPQAVQDEARFAATTVNTYRGQLRETLRQADEAAADRREIALTALSHDTDLRNDVAVVDMIEIQTDGQKRSALAAMTATADAAAALRDEAADAKAFKDRLAKIMPSSAASFSELQRTEAALTALSEDLSDSDTLKFLFNYATTVAKSMKEQAAAANTKAEK